MTKPTHTPNNAELAKAERIIHDMDNAIYKLYDIFGYEGNKQTINNIHQISSLLSDIRRNTLEKFTHTRCRYCGKPIFTPVYVDYENEGLKPVHKRCAHELHQHHLRRQKWQSSNQ